ncbi:hypothetical protein UFOVP53_122 [uncultured Caudovirales phage]|uniref:Uncharacterized protein n=1 Tax=uncultured Caudovirales phage TaxID=2100421 RepID=A0A6J5KVY0_9CAUD|nr:hypothetical protein UFOVP53_122 [uncultured Caudovirales phage]
MASKSYVYKKINKTSIERNVFMKFMRTIHKIGLIDVLITAPSANWNGVSFDLRVELIYVK